MAQPLREEQRTGPGRRLRVVRGRGGGDRGDRVEREDLSLSHPAPPPPQHHRATRELLLSERALATWLRRRLGTVGAVAMVRRFGARAVLDALYDNVVLRDEWAAGGLAVNPQLKSPGGFLRTMLEDREAGR